MGIKSAIETSLEIKAKREEILKKRHQEEFNLRESKLNIMKSDFLKDLKDYDLLIEVNSRQRNTGIYYPYLVIINKKDTSKHLEVTVEHRPEGGVYYYGATTMYLEYAKIIHDQKHLEECLGEYLVDHNFI